MEGPQDLLARVRWGNLARLALAGLLALALFKAFGHERRPGPLPPDERLSAPPSGATRPRSRRPKSRPPPRSERATEGRPPRRRPSRQRRSEPRSLPPRIPVAPGPFSAPARPPLGAGGGGEFAPG